MESTPVIHNFSHEAFGSRFWIRIAAEDGEGPAGTVQLCPLDRLRAKHAADRRVGGLLVLIWASAPLCGHHRRAPGGPP